MTKKKRLFGILLFFALFQFFSVHANGGIAAYYIYPIEKIRLTYQDVTNPVEIILSHPFSMKMGTSQEFYGTDGTMYDGTIPNGVITKIELYHQGSDAYDSNNNIIWSYTTPDWIVIDGLNISVSEGEHAKITTILNGTWSAAKEAL
jgi:hypothetical protein